MITSIESYKDSYGRDQNRIYHECDGPGCSNQTTFEPERGGEQPIIQSWWRIAGPDDEVGGDTFCSKACLARWAITTGPPKP